MDRMVFLLFVWMGLVFFGCQSARRQAAPPVISANVRKIVVLIPGSPIARDWRGDAGPDGILANAYFFQSANRPPVAARGVIHAFLYDQRDYKSNPRQAKPIYQWTFDLSQARQHVRRDQLGWLYYQFPLDWGRKVPKGPDVLLIFAFEPQSDNRKWTYSLPAPIMVRRK